MEPPMAKVIFRMANSNEGIDNSAKVETTFEEFAAINADLFTDEPWGALSRDLAEFGFVTFSGNQGMNCRLDVVK
jgi:hypothetical protein